MELAAAAATHNDDAASASEQRRAVVWHDLECGRYVADLPLWQELAQGLSDEQEILEVGAGTGRVALDLARRGHRVTALDSDAALLAALEQRRGGLALTTVLADARSFALSRTQVALCLVPMQTLQLLGGEHGRMQFLCCARAHMRHGAVLACAIADRPEAFDCAAEDISPVRELARDGNELYCSEAVRVRVSKRTTVIERRRLIAPAAGPGGATERDSQRYTIELDHIAAADIEHEALASGFEPLEQRAIPATAAHSGSLVVVLRAR